MEIRYIYAINIHNNILKTISYYKYSPVLCSLYMAAVKRGGDPTVNFSNNIKTDQTQNNHL